MLAPLLAASCWVERCGKGHSQLLLCLLHCFDAACQPLLAKCWLKWRSSCREQEYGAVQRCTSIGVSKVIGLRQGEGVCDHRKATQQRPWDGALQSSQHKPDNTARYSQAGAIGAIQDCSACRGTQLPVCTHLCSWTNQSSSKGQFGSVTPANRRTCTPKGTAGPCWCPDRANEVVLQSNSLYRSCYGGRKAGETTSRSEKAEHEV